MTSNLMQSKYRKVFDIYDGDRDGKIEKNDIDALLLIWRRDCGAKSNSPEWNRTTELGDRFWQELLGHTDTDGNKEVSFDEFVESVQREDFINNVVVPFSVAVFELADTDNDGRASEQQWVSAQIKAGMPEDESREVFSQLDSDGDGYVTKEEYQRGVEEFYLSDDPNATGNRLAGRI